MEIFPVAQLMGVSTLYYILLKGLRYSNRAVNDSNKAVTYGGDFFFFWSSALTLSRGGSRVWKEGGHLAEKSRRAKKKKKVTTIIAIVILYQIYYITYVM